MINERGNSGRIRGNYEDAELKVLVFGDSVTQRPRKDERGEYMTWPNFLQDHLEQSLTTSTHVVNFARDGYGLLQMFDLAAAKVPEWKPDLFIIAFISDDITRDRFWRSVTTIDGRRRIMVSRTPDLEPNWETAAEAFLLEPQATAEWCEHLLESGAIDDPLVEEMEDAVIDGRRRISLLADPLSFTKSFVLEQIMHGSPYHSTFNRPGPSQMPRHTLSSFELDERLKKKVRILKDSGIPYVIIHLAGYFELQDGSEYRDKKNHRKLIQSLEKLTGTKIHGTLDNIDVSEFDIEKIPTDPKGDRHPSLYDHQFYARSVLNVLLNHVCPIPACEISK